MEKWTGELADPPFWLDPNLEVVDAAPKMPKGVAVIACVQALVSLGLPLQTAVEVAANTMNETAWMRSYRAWNLGGWKITKSTNRNPDGTARRWWRALGNKSSGDAQTCFYRAFGSLQEFYAAWVENFFSTNPKSRYFKTGEEARKGNEWFDDLIAAGYKGAVTQHNPLPSMKEHASIVKSIMVFYAQHVLGVGVDGKWGPVSRAACEKYQKANGLKVTGKLDEATLTSLTDGGAPKAVATVTPLLAKREDADDDALELAA